MKNKRLGKVHSAATLPSGRVTERSRSAPTVARRRERERVE